MRCFLKSYFYCPAVVMYTGIVEPFDRLYQGADWEFTGKIKYQKNPDGQMIVSFGINSLQDDVNLSQWYETEEFDFDESTAAVIIDCNAA